MFPMHRKIAATTSYARRQARTATAVPAPASSRMKDRRWQHRSSRSEDGARVPKSRDPPCFEAHVSFGAHNGHHAMSAAVDVQDRVDRLLRLECGRQRVEERSALSLRGRRYAWRPSGRQRPPLRFLWLTARRALSAIFHTPRCGGTPLGRASEDAPERCHFHRAQ